MIKIICLGKIKEKYLNDAVTEYQKRLSKYTKLEIIELKDEEDLKKDEEKIKKVINEKDNIVMLDKDGKEYTSEGFKDFIEKELTLNSNITFLIGSSYGFSKDLKDEINKKVSFSHLTFPHQLFRVLLLEQIYRAFKIINNETYHK